MDLFFFFKSTCEYTNAGSHEENKVVFVVTQMNSIHAEKKQNDKNN